MPKIMDSIGKKRNTLGNNFGTFGKNCRRRSVEEVDGWYSNDVGKPMIGYTLDEDGNYPENWRWF